MSRFGSESPERMFFAELYRLSEKYYGADRKTLEDCWDDFCMETDLLHKRYANVSPELNRFARFMIIGLIDWFNAEYSEKGGIHGN